MPDISRRNFMKIGSAAGTAALLPAPLRAIAIQSLSPKDGALLSATRLDTGW